MWVGCSPDIIGPPGPGMRRYCFEMCEDLPADPRGVGGSASICQTEALLSDDERIEAVPLLARRQRRALLWARSAHVGRMAQPAVDQRPGPTGFEAAAGS